VKVQVVEIKDLVAGGPSTKGSNSPSSWHIVDPSSLEQNQRCVDDAVAGDSSGNGNDD
jgi:hypothetical protein